VTTTPLLYPRRRSANKRRSRVWAGFAPGAGGYETDMDAIRVLKTDHQSIEGLFRELEAAGPRAIKTKTRLVKKITAGLSTHAYIEERIFYPDVRSKVPDLTSQVLEGMEEHHIVKWTLHELDGMTPDDEEYGAKLAVLMENVRRHVKEEERGLFPGLRKTLTRDELSELGDRVSDARRLAPTRPHPQAPSANSVVGPVAGAVDRARDVGSALVERFTGH
jgi:hemerythrin superfamily protein